VGGWARSLTLVARDVRCVIKACGK
jgi:hypothetical protein